MPRRREMMNFDRRFLRVKRTLPLRRQGL